MKTPKTFLHQMQVSVMNPRVAVVDVHKAVPWQFLKNKELNSRAVCLEVVGTMVITHSTSGPRYCPTGHTVTFLEENNPKTLNLLSRMAVANLDTPAPTIATVFKIGKDRLQITGSWDFHSRHQTLECAGYPCGNPTIGAST